MKKLFWLAVGVAILASLFASAFPDGLDRVAAKLGFSARGVEQAAPLAGYTVPFLKAGAISTAAAGITGVLVTLAFFWLTAHLLKLTATK